MTDMMDSKTTRTATVVLCFMGCLALGLTFTRDGTGNYNDEAKWDHEGGFCYASPYCYPHSTNDDATIGEGVTINLTQDEEIDDMGISGSHVNDPTVFTTGGTVKTVECYSITISDAYVVVEELAVLKTVDEP